MLDHCIAFLGDVVLCGPVKVGMPLPRHFVLNLEGPLTRAEARNPTKISLKMPPDAFTATFPVRPAAVNLANNHIFDYGAAGFEDTLNYLASNSVPFFGAGTARENCHNPVIVSVAGQKVALLGYVDRFTEPVTSAGPYACATLEVEAVKRDMLAARQAGADFLVVSIHWGAEQVYLPRPGDITLARLLVSEGADLVIGHHAHRVQPWERLGTKAVFYGLGNAIFADADAWTTDGCGIARRVAVAQDRPWNRRSLVVLADPVARRCTAAEMQFDGGAMVESTGRQIGPTRGLGGFAYTQRYRLSHLAGRLGYASRPYFQHRRLPRPSHVRLLWGMVASSLQGTPKN
jgi:poly-gamma-glutamate synthesis protein (capsule biosynthesis protein)